jgi:hypothetical protein
LIQDIEKSQTYTTRGPGGGDGPLVPVPTNPGNNGGAGGDGTVTDPVTGVTIKRGAGGGDGSLIRTGGYGAGK